MLEENTFCIRELPRELQASLPDVSPLRTRQMDGITPGRIHGLHIVQVGGASYTSPSCNASLDLGLAVARPSSSRSGLNDLPGRSDPEINQKDRHLCFGT
jgi:hypothetical protein